MTKQRMRKSSRPRAGKPTDRSAFWGAIIRAIEAEPREVTSLRGASGIEHPVLAAGVDEGRRRLIIISEDHDARSSAMMQADIQSAFDGVHVVVARPILLSVREIARNVSAEPISEDESFHTKVITRMTEVFFKAGLDVLDPSVLVGSGGPLQYMRGIVDLSKAWSQELESERSSIDYVDRFLSLVPEEQDQTFGLCPIPLYKFSEKDLEAISSGNDIEGVRDVLSRQNILQYFFPPPDNLALGIIDRAPIRNLGQLVEQVGQAPKLGHPFGQAEIMESKMTIPQMIDELRARNLIVEGEVGFELSAEGESVRHTVRYKPREGLLSKIINRFSLNIDLKDLFR